MRDHRRMISGRTVPARASYLITEGRPDLLSQPSCLTAKGVAVSSGGAMPPHLLPGYALARQRTKIANTPQNTGDAFAPLVLPLLYDFPDPGKYHRFPCSSPPRTR
jgi:hypothetical protein